MKNLQIGKCIVVSIMLTGLVGSGACSKDSTPEEIIDGNVCEASIDCGSDDFVCVGGTCVPGQCTFSAVDAREAGTTDPDVLKFGCGACEICSLQNTCVADPSVPLGPVGEVDESGNPLILGPECLEDGECGTGEVCSRGTCYNAASRDECTASHQCRGGERCDVQKNICVDDVGGCKFCECYPELCCDETERCDTTVVEIGRCVSNQVQDECMSDSDCFENELTRGRPFCSELNRCIQCRESADCGPGLFCNEDGRCISEESFCLSDDDCSNDTLCLVAEQTCVRPECEDDRDCEDRRESCDISTYTCILGAPDCSDDDSNEPDNTLEEAQSVEPGREIVGTICREDTDIMVFDGLPGHRYDIVVRFDSFDFFSSADPLTVSLQGNTGEQLAFNNDPDFDGQVRINAVTPQDFSGSLYLLIAGTGVTQDTWNYELIINESLAGTTTTCDDEVSLGVEPNDTLADAYALELGTHDLVRCGESDEDYYIVNVSSRKQVDFVLTNGATSGWSSISMEIFDAADPTVLLGTQSSFSNDSIVRGAEGVENYILRVYNDDFSPDENQGYTISIRETLLPEECANDALEPNGVADLASPMVGNTVSGQRCGPSDVDMIAFDVPASSLGIIELSFDSAFGDLQGAIFDATNNVVATVSGSGGNDDLLVFETPVVGSLVTYYLGVFGDPDAFSTASVQSYDVTLTLSDAAACSVSEPFLNNTLENGICFDVSATTMTCDAQSWPAGYMTPTLATCESATTFTPGCGNICGANDSDWHRFGPVDGERPMTATLTYNPSLIASGSLGLRFGRSDLDGSNTQSFLLGDNNPANNGNVTVTMVSGIVGNPKEYGVRVEPQGEGPFLNVPYSLELSVGAPCLEDSFEPNNTDSTATLLRQGGALSAPFTDSVNGTLCTADKDFFSWVLLAGESVTVTYLGPSGYGLELKPASAAPVSATELAGTCPLGTVAAGQTCQALTYTSSAVAGVNLELSAIGSGAAIGAYTMRIDISN